ncbi:hypothetical protein Fmac_018980 [Flemingia macrophylla]|uniref:50S ribosomal protein L33, chloroplastic n=1 Tax=Flemingia macrophylla TaxID=520843 RepID=A0ABD1M6J6_9FABA
MACASGVVCSGLAVPFSGEKRNSYFNFDHPLHANIRPFNALFSRGYLSKDMLCRPTHSPVVCMAKGSSSKKKSKIIRLVSTAGTGFFYALKKSKKMDKLELKKYDPKVKRHVLFRESK